jgi:hypothetical protein
MEPIEGNILYSPVTLIGFSTILGIISWSYIQHIPFLLYSNIGLVVTCIILLNKFAYRKNAIRWNGGWNGLSFTIILYFFVFITMCLNISYIFIKKN